MPSAAQTPSPTLQADFSARPSTGPRQRWYFYFFCLSGFCSILYELIWLRLAMAQFGVTTAMVSIVLSTFMAGLGIGSWAAGHLLRKYATRLNTPPLHLYAAAEILIGCSAVIVPLELRAGRYVLEHIGNSLSLSSNAYYVAAGMWIACTLIPWCSCMGATIPLGMFAIRNEERFESRMSPGQTLFSRQSFSFLYLANVLGAVAGTIIPLFLIELWGFTRTLQVGMLLNLAICGGALRLAGKAVQSQKQVERNGEEAERDAEAAPSLSKMLVNGTLWLLFATGLTSMGMEVVWTRLYTIYVGTLVYSFAMILGIYLAATFIGSKLYRSWSQRRDGGRSLVWLVVWLTALIPLLTADSRIGISAALRVPLGIAGFSCLLGFLTPKLVDRFSEGDPDRAGIGYAVNVAGCILGPLVAGFGLLPHVDERYALVILATPWLLVGGWFALFQPATTRPHTRLAIANITSIALILSTSFFLISRTQSYVQQIAGAQVRRDNTATVIAAGEGMNKNLYVNGVAMTYLTPITKMMSALPLASLDHAPKSVLVICFGMGTTYRSMLSWGIDSTAVDLVPSVPALFHYFHADAPLLLQSPNSHVIIDDGRRFLERTNSQYDVIVIDPPPPIGAAGSSLLYSREFYSAAQKRLRPDGILMQWYPGGDHATTAAISRALKESFHYVRAFGSFEGWGVHYLASQQPLPNRSATELADRMPPNAAADLVEWGPFSTAEQQFAAVLKNEIPIDMLIGLDKDAPTLLDDRPVNEYGLLRHIHLSGH
jgi:spermidine synthase